jgi:hypothetical protein
MFCKHYAQRRLLLKVSGHHVGLSAGMFAASKESATPLVSCFAALVEGPCACT